MQRIVSNMCNTNEISGVKSFENSKILYEDSLPFKSARNTIRFSSGLKCRQCGLKSKHNSQSGYCYFHKRIVDMNENCSSNTINSYKNVNFRR